MKRNVFLIGPVGAGKSTVGKQLTDALKLQFFDTDREIERNCGVEIDWIFDMEGEAGFRKREEDIIHELTEKQGIVLATGGGAIVSAENRKRLAARGIVVYLKATVSQQLSRTERDKTRPLLQVDDKQKQLELMNAERTPLYEEIADIVIDTDGNSVRKLSDQIIDQIEALA